MYKKIFQKTPTSTIANKIIAHYTYEKRFHSFKRDMHRIYDDTFQNKTDKDIKLIIGNRNHRDAKKELIGKRAKKFLLKNKTLKSKFSIVIHVSCIQSTIVFFHSLIEKPNKLKTKPPSDNEIDK
jgi:hypothetical protein